MLYFSILKTFLFINHLYHNYCFLKLIESTKYSPALFIIKINKLKWNTMMSKNKGYFDSNIVKILAALKDNSNPIIFDKFYDDGRLSVKSVSGELLTIIKLSNGHFLIQRLYPICTDLSTLSIYHTEENKVLIKWPTSTGKVEVEIELISEITDLKQIAYSARVTLEVNQNIKLNLPGRDIIVCTQDFEMPDSPIHFEDQREGRTGICFTDFGKNAIGHLFYLQDFGALHELAEDTQNSYLDTVKLDWPQLGFKLPPMLHPLKRNGKYTINQSYVVLSFEDSNVQDARSDNDIYMHSLRKVYDYLEKPEPKKVDVLDYAQKSIHDLMTHRGCWKQVDAYAYLNAYINNYDTPPESMVQAAILKPLYLYHRDFGNSHSEQIIADLSANLTSFYDEEINATHRWLPAESFKLSFEEEHMRSYIMDSWYLHYPLLQLGFLFEQGFEDPILRKQFEKSLLYLRQAAKEFDDQWPIFFNIYTFEILKKEGNPNEYGEKDTAGLFVLTMLKAYHTLHKEVYLKEAIRAAEKLKKTDFDGLYQSNNTAYAAEALLELYTLKPDKTYLAAAEIYIGNVIRNCSLWDMKYGNAKERESFFSLFPLKETLYVAAFEEHETVAIFHRILHLHTKHKIPFSENIVFFMTEYIKYALLRMPYYFPPLLPADILAVEVKSGYVNPQLWIPLEDLGDGWDAVGQVGQEVYGASVFFNLCHHHIVQLNHEVYAISSLPFMNNGNREIELLGAENQDGKIWLNSGNSKVEVQINNKKQDDNYTYIVYAKDKIKFTLKK